MLVRCRPCLYARQRGVARTYAVFDMPAICAGATIGGVRVLIVEDEPYLAEAIRDGLRLKGLTIS